MTSIFGRAGKIVMNFPESLLKALRTARRIAVFTGAGISAESGLSTFRVPQSGLWARFRPEDLATPQAFDRRPDFVWGWYEWRRMMVMRAQPNPAHRAIAELAARCADVAVVTQNVDDLHERAGSRDVIRLHGSILHPRCRSCGQPYDFGGPIPDEPEGGREVPPPRCGACRGLVRPGVVWFGETLPVDALESAFAAARRCDLMFSIGTSAMVHPAAAVPQVAAASGAVVVQVNLGPTPLDVLTEHNLVGAAGILLPALLKSAWG